MKSDFSQRVRNSFYDMIGEIEELKQKRDQAFRDGRMNKYGSLNVKIMKKTIERQAMESKPLGILDE